MLPVFRHPLNRSAMFGSEKRELREAFVSQLLQERFIATEGGMAKEVEGGASCDSAVSLRRANLIPISALRVYFTLSDH